MAIKLTDKQKETGWQIVRFGEIARNISERVEPAETDLEVYVGLEHLDPQSLRITRHGVPSDVKGQKLRVRPGQIIFGKRRAYQKKVAIADFDGICSAHAMVLEAVPGKIIPELLPFLMQSDMFMDRAVAISEGSLSPTIKWKALAMQEFPLPPIARQKEILEVLEKVEECLAYSIATSINMTIFQKAYVAKLIPSLKYTSVRQQSLLIPIDWNVKKLSELSVKVSSGTTPSRAKPEYYCEATIPWVKTLDLNENTIISTHESVSKKALDETSLKVHPEKTVLLAMYGGFNQIGRTGILGVRATTNQALCAIQVDKGLILPEYLHLWLKINVPYWKKVAASSRKDPNLTKCDVNDMPVCYPSLQKQKAFVELFEQAEYMTDMFNSRSSVYTLIQRHILCDGFETMISKRGD